MHKLYIAMNTSNFPRGLPTSFSHQLLFLRFQPLSGSTGHAISSCFRYCKHSVKNSWKCKTCWWVKLAFFSLSTWTLFLKKASVSSSSSLYLKYSTTNHTSCLIEIVVLCSYVASAFRSSSSLSLALKPTVTAGKILLLSKKDMSGAVWSFHWRIKCYQKNHNNNYNRNDPPLFFLPVQFFFRKHHPSFPLKSLPSSSCTLCRIPRNPNNCFSKVAKPPKHSAT